MNAAAQPCATHGGDGVALAVASARPLRMIEQVLGDDLGLFDALLVSNGAAVLRPGCAEPTHTALLGVPVVETLVGAVREVWPGAGFGWESGTAFGHDHRFADLATRQWVLRDLGAAALDAPPEQGLHQLVVLVPDREAHECLDLARAAVGEHAAVTDSHGGVVELSAPDADKAAAARRWTASRGIDLGSTVAFGDEHNDLPALVQAGLGVAVANAREAVRAAADRVTVANDDDGVAVVLSERSVRRTARRLLRDLHVDPPLAVETLRGRLESARGHPLQLIPHAFPDTSTVGLLVQTSAVDLVYYEGDFTAEQQRRTILHEFGHLVLEHPPREGGEVTEAVWRSVAPTLPPEVVVKVLCRSAHGNPPEVEAEVFASVLLAWDAAIAGASPHGASALERAFDQPRGWL